MAASLYTFSWIYKSFFFFFFIILSASKFIPVVAFGFSLPALYLYLIHSRILKHSPQTSIGNDMIYVLQMGKLDAQMALRDEAN